MGGHREGIRNGGGGAAADLRKPPVHEVVAKLTPGEFERVVDIVRRSPDHFPSVNAGRAQEPQSVTGRPAAIV